MCQLISPRIEFSIGQMLLFVDYSYCISCPGDLSFKQPVKTLVLQSAGCSIVLLHQQQLPLSSVPDCQLLLFNLRWHRHICPEFLPQRCKGIISRYIVSTVCNFTSISVGIQGCQLLPSVIYASVSSCTSKEYKPEDTLPFSLHSSIYI